MMDDIFKNRKLLIATKHGKESVIAPIFEKRFGFKCFASDNFDSDCLGTFTGEVARTLDPLTTARKKCLLAMELNDCDLAIASEGSFGHHPIITFMPADDEWLFFMDRKNGLEIYARELSSDTNFNGQLIKTEQELELFAMQAKFPSHALIIRKSNHESVDIVKGITDRNVLHESFCRLKQKYGEVYAETDMRAIYNPTRLLAIEKAAVKLADKINNRCPACSTPGFSITDAKIGLHCQSCSSPTKSVLSYIRRCIKCGYTNEELYPNNKRVEEPGFCDVCNP